MDIDKALAELRAAFPRVDFVIRGEWIYSDANAVHPHYEDPSLWACHGRFTSDDLCTSEDPVSAVRAWLAAQPTATFYPEAPSGETEEYAGWIAIGSRRDYGLCRDFGPGMEWESKQSAADGLDHHCDEARFHRFVIRVPAPVDPPVLVGEVSDV